MLTLLVDIRIRLWCEEADILPPTQNGFRPHYRTNNNVHILRTAIDQARMTHGKVFAAFIDLANAFPTVHRAGLWFKMFRLGAGGPIFDWLRNLYHSMKYAVRGENKYSDAFRASLGILIGDPASPIAFLIYMADFKTVPDADDVYLNGTAVPHLEHADDLVLLSTTVAGLQRKLDRLGQWAADNLMVTSVQKSCVMAFGYRQPPKVDLTLYGAVLPWKTEYTYVGIKLSSVSRNIFANHYKYQAQRARSVANSTLFLEWRIGKMDPVNGKRLYLAQIDPFLISGCDICIDNTATDLKPLQNVQHAYLRRILGLSQSALTSFLFTELGLWPIAYRRLALALRYLEYLRNLPDGHLAREATLESLTMIDAKPQRGWYHCLRTRLADMANGHVLPDFLLLTDHCVPDAMVALTASLESDIKARLQLSPKAYLATTQVVYDKKGNPSYPTLHFRHYLRIHRQSRLRVMTLLVLSDHELSLEALRRVRPKIDRERRLCRLCERQIESPEHLLFECEGPFPTEYDEIRDSLEQRLKNHAGPQWVGATAEWKFHKAMQWHDIIDDLAEVA